MAGIKKNMFPKQLMPSFGKAAQAPQAQSPKATGMDQLGGFLNQLKSGGFKPNLNQPPRLAEGVGQRFSAVI